MTASFRHNEKMMIKSNLIFCLSLILLLWSCKTIKGEEDTISHIVSNKALNSKKVKIALNDAIKLLGQVGNNPRFKLEFAKDHHLEIPFGSSDFYISADKNQIVIYGGENDNSFINGIYYYLEAVGFRFFGYSDNGIYIPSNPQHPKFDKKLVKRKGPNLVFFGTGGTGWDNEMKNAIQLYKLRNGINANISGVSHSFHTFYKDNKEIIDQYPKILTDYKGKKKDPNLDHPKTMPLIKSWIKNKIIQKPEKYKYLISVSPADGMSSKNTLLPKSINEIQTVSEKGLWIANEVMKYLEQELPNWKGYVGYNVYGNGKNIVTPPSFQLHPRVFVQLVPYAFQRDYRSDIEMFEDWKDHLKLNTTSIRDYWNITQWSQGLPTADFYDLIKKRIHVWEEYGFSYFNLESTYFGALTMPHFYALNQYLKGYRNNTIDEYYEEYFDKSFGNGAADIQKLYLQWSTQFKGESDISQSLIYLDQAFNKSQKNHEKNRIIELMAYMHWMVLHYQCKKDPTIENALQLERYAKKIRTLGVTQSYTVWRYNYGKVKPYGYDESPDKWTDYLTNISFEQLKSEVLKDFRKDLKKHNKIYQRSKVKVDSPNISTIPVEHKVIEESTYISSKNTYEFTPLSNEILTFSWTSKDINDYVIVNEGKADEKVFKPQKIGEENVIHLKVKRTNKYTISFVPERKSNIKYKLPAETNFFLIEGKFSSSNKKNTWYFYVPKDVKSILVKPSERNGYATTKGKISAVYRPKSDGTFQLVEPEFTFDKQRNKVYKQEFAGTYVIDVKPEDAGKVWLLKMRVYKWEIINFDPIISKTRFKVIERD